MSLSIELNQGKTSPLGASINSNGINFAVYAPLAKQLYVCLFDSSGHTEVLKLAMNNNEGGIWSLFITPLPAGTLYGYRAEGEYQPKKGLYFNSQKLLIDPYAKDLFGEFTWSERHYSQMPIGTLS